MVLYGAHFARINNRDKAKNNMIDKALYIEVRRASRLSLQCNMLLRDLLRKEENILNEVEHIRTSVGRLDELVDNLIGHDIKIDNFDDVQYSVGEVRLIILHQRQILKHLEKIEQEMDNTSFEDKERE